MICEACHGKGFQIGAVFDQSPASWLLGMPVATRVVCWECQGSGLTQGVKSMLTRVEYWVDSKYWYDKPGWYICHYDDVDAMLAKSAYDTIGPYDTEAEAKRVLAETTDLDKEENTSARKKAYDPSRDPTPASLDAGIPTDNDDLETGPSEVV